MKGEIHDHACTNCVADKGPCLGECNVYDENRNLAAGVMQEYFPNGGRDWDQILSLFDAIYAGKIPGVQVQTTQLEPPRNEMLEYIKTAIGEGYQPEHEDAVSDLSVIDGLNDGDLNREFGKCWQWYNLGGGIHETYAEKDGAKADSQATKGRYNYYTFKAASKPLIQWLNENANPHASVIVDCTSAVLFTGEIAVNTKEFLKD